ncbi:MAG: hypothetical protein N2645_21950 [Clostridia bacterium]|nr:hypothetical protein [Clostridia bacterium]
MRNRKKVLPFILSMTMVLILALQSVVSFAENFYVSDNLIYAKWTKLGGSTGFLGIPTTNTLLTPNNLGVYNHFQGGSIYRKNTFTEAFAVYGSIRQKWAQLGWENSSLGFPTTDETDTYNKTGRFNHFEGGSVYYKWGASSAYALLGDIRNLWSWFGWETSQLGFPTTDEYSVNGKRASHFENGAMYWKKDTYTNQYLTWPVMSKAKLSQSTPFGTQKINSVKIENGGGGDFPQFKFTVSGSGFGANRRVGIYLSDLNWYDTITTVVTDSNGAFSYSGYAYVGSAISSVNNVVTVWARAIDFGPAAIYSYDPTNITTDNINLD